MRPFFKAKLVARPTNANRMEYTYGRPTIIERKESNPDADDIIFTFLNCNAVRRSVQALRDYLFIEGFEWVPKWSRRCRECAEEHPPKTKPERCEKCGSHDVFDALGNKIKWYTEPDKTITQVMDRRFRSVNKNKHSLKEVLRDFEVWLNVLDDAFLVCPQAYKTDADGEIVSSRVTEMVVADGRNFKMVQDPVFQTPGGQFFICIEPGHRPGTYVDEKTGAKVEKGTAQKKPGRCPMPGCGKKLHDVWYVTTEPSDYQKITQYFIEREVIHASKYSGSYGYGFSPIVSIYSMASTLMRMEDYIRTFYEEERAPRMAIFVGTPNPEGLKAVMESSQDVNVSQNAHYVPTYVYDPGEGGGANVQVERFSVLPDELQLLEIRDEFYRRIGSAFGVAPVFQGNVDAGGLQNQGPTQWAVTKLAAQIGQEIYNEKVLPRLLELLDVSDWELHIKEPEESDEMEKLNVRLSKVQEALLMAQAGFPAMTRSLEGEFEFPNTMQMPMGGGGMPMPGMGEEEEEDGPPGEEGGGNGFEVEKDEESGDDDGEDEGVDDGGYILG